MFDDKVTEDTVDKKKDNMDSKDHPSRFQKGTKFNRFLPYFGEICKEADDHLSAIKVGLCHSVLMRETCPVLEVWAIELDKYIELHGYRFTKAEHVQFVKLFMELVCMPNLEQNLMETFASVLTTLLKKSKLLSQQDLELPWRPLYDIYVFIKYKHLTKTFRKSKNLKDIFKTLIKVARDYFPVESTKEILIELRPLMYPHFDTSFKRAIMCSNLFLPTNTAVADHERTWKLWLDEMIFWYLNVQNSPKWERKMVELLARVSYDNIGYIDMSHVLPVLFTRVLRSIGLTLTIIGMEEISIGFSPVYNADEVAAIWIVSTMGGSNEAQKYISQLFAAVDSYVHPSSCGDWQSRIFNFADSLAYAVSERVHFERYHKPDWRKTVPDEWKLTDKQIDEFVSSVLPCVLNGIYAKEDSTWPVSCLRYLSHLSPKMVVTAVLDKLYPALETFTEPHRLTQTLSALVSVILPLVREKGANSCRNHVLPLLTGLLPCLNPNDIVNTEQAVIALSVIFTLVPIVDCSEAVNVRTDFTGEDLNLCCATAAFENYIYLFMDKIILIVDSLGTSAVSGHLLRRRDSILASTEEETTLINGALFLFRSLLTNCSKAIHEIVVNRLFSYLSSNSFEGNAQLDLMATLCLIAVRTGPKEIFRKFLLYFLQQIKTYSTQDVHNDERADTNIVCYATLCSKMFLQVNDLLTHKKEIWELLHLLSSLKWKEVYSKVALIIENLIVSLGRVYIIDDQNSAPHLDDDLKDYLPVQHWGEACKLDDFSVRWHIPNTDEISFVRELHQFYIIDALKYLENPEKLSRDEILKALTLMESCVGASFNLMPPLDGKIIKIVDSQVNLPKLFRYSQPPSCCKLGTSLFENLDPNFFPKFYTSALDYDGQNTRKYIFDKLHGLMEFLLTNRQYETKCLLAICSIFFFLLVRQFVGRLVHDGFEQMVKYYRILLSDKAQKKNSFVFALISFMTSLQHYKRVAEDNCDAYHFTVDHLAIVEDLIKLCSSQYSEVRARAQGSLAICMNEYPLSYRLITDSIVHLLDTNSPENDDSLKGAVNMLGLAENRGPYFMWNNFDLMIKVWPSLIKVQHSEEPTSIELMENIQQTFVACFQTFQITFNMSEKAIKLAKTLMEKWDLIANVGEAVQNEDALNVAIQLENDCIQHNKRSYYELIRILVDLANDKNLHWRQLDMVYAFLQLLVRFDVAFPQNAIKVYTHLLVHDNIKTREEAIYVLTSILKNQKKKSAKIQLPTSEFIRFTESSGDNIQPVLSSDKWPIAFGFRKDNQFLACQKEYLPKTAEEYNELLFIDKIHFGFYCWPVVVTVPDVIKKQVEHSFDQLSSETSVLFNAISDSDFATKMCTLMSMEDEESAEGDNSTYLSAFFKELFRIYQDSLLVNFKDIIAQFAISSKPAEQRVASEFLSGLIAGAKYWTFDQQMILRAWVTPVLESAFENFTTETVEYWLSFCYNVFISQDVRKLYWLIELLIQLTDKPDDSSFISANRYYFLQVSIAQQKLRLLETSNEVLANVCRQLDHPYQNLRERLGSLLYTILTLDYPEITLDTNVRPPTKFEFFKAIQPKLSVLWREVELGHPSFIDAVSEESAEVAREQGILTLKTVLCFLDVYFLYAIESAPLSILNLLPLLCYYENETSDDELKDSCRSTFMAGMAVASMKPNLVDPLLNIFNELSKNKWWKCRVSLLHYIQVSIFSNLFLYSSKECRTKITTILLTLLKDEQLEVRESAADCLTGLLRCSYLGEEMNSLLDEFRTWCRNADVIVHHGGVLGLAAIVKSFPYTVPDFLPDVLIVISKDVIAAHPIGVSAKNALSEFKRTHHDGWHEHKLCFTDDQLCLLTDLLVSPNYYV